MDSATQRSFDSEEALFKRLAENLREAREEVESALRELVHEYSTTNRENRFVVGGVVESVIAAAMRHAGIDVDDLGHQAEGADLATYKQAVRSRFSLKSTFSRSSGSLRLINVMGDNPDARWTDPTIFVVPELGVVLGHPAHEHLAQNVTRTSDALIISLRHVRQHAEARPDLLIELDVPWDPRTGTRVASVDVARAILERPHYPRLGALVRRDDAVERLVQLDHLLDRGRISLDEFTEMKSRIIGAQD